MPKPPDRKVRLYNEDCLKTMSRLKDNSVDSIVTDPPYGISFMSKKWDYDIPSVEIWEECLRVLKPGGFLLSFGGCRTYHRLVCNIEDAGFITHPLIAWVFGSGFPKAANLSKNIDKAAGAKRKTIRTEQRYNEPSGIVNAGRGLNARKKIERKITSSTTEAAKQWDGFFYGLQCLKPAIEPVCMAQKPYDGKPIESIQKWQCGALNIAECRVGTTGAETHRGGYQNDFVGGRVEYEKGKGVKTEVKSQGRWPANLILSHHPECVQVGMKKVKTGTAVRKNIGVSSKGMYSPGRDGKGNDPKDNMSYADADGLETVEDWDCHPDCPMTMFPDTGKSVGGKPKSAHNWMGNRSYRETANIGGLGDSGSAARFFYCAKANKKDRDDGLEGFEAKSVFKGKHPDNPVCQKCGGSRYDRGGGICNCKNPRWGVNDKEVRNSHPTVKPTKLMRYLCRLVTPPNGIVFDPFMGSGSTGKACMLESFRFIGCDNDTEHGYFEIAKKRIKTAYAKTT